MRKNVTMYFVDLVKKHMVPKPGKEGNDALGVVNLVTAPELYNQIRKLWETWEIRQ